MTFFRISALFALLCMAAPAFAQSAPQYDRSQLAVGATYSWESSNGLSKAINLGLVDGVYHFLVTDRAANGDETETLYGTNQEGRLLWSDLEGDIITYQPHDCSFVTTSCKSELFAGGNSIGTTSTTAFYADGIWTHIVETHIQDQPSYTSYVCGIYDQDSIIQVLYAIDSDSDTPFWLRITSGPNAGQSQEMLARVTDACQKARPIS